MNMTMGKDVYKITLPTPFQVGDVNVYLVKGDKLTLIDAGVKTQECWEHFQAQLHDLGYGLADIEQIVLTHHHPDHVGMLDFFPKNLRVIGHSNNTPWISQDLEFFRHYEQFFRLFFKKMGVPPILDEFFAEMEKTFMYSCNRLLTDEVLEGETIPGLPDWEVLEVPGHASSHIALYRKKDGVLIGGDLLLAHISSNPIIEPPSIGKIERNKSLLQYNQSLRKLLEFNISVCFSGHGEEVQNVHSLVAKRLMKQKERAYSVKAMLEEKARSAFEVCQLLFPNMYKKQLGLTMSETVGQLDFLEDLGEIIVDKSKEQWRFIAK